jgi:hypothetical protein
MKYQKTLAAALAGIFILAAPLSATDIKDLPLDSSTVVPPAAAFSVDRGTWALFNSDLKHEQDFQGAADALKQGLTDQAANAISRGEAYLKIERGRATAKGKNLLSTSAKELNELAKSVRSGRTRTLREISPVFARADLALAKHHYYVSQQEWDDQEQSTSADDLEQAAGDLRAAMDWQNYEPVGGLSDSLSMTLQTCEGLRMGGNFDPGEVNQAFSVVKRGLDEFSTVADRKDY